VAFSFLFSPKFSVRLKALTHRYFTIYGGADGAINDTTVGYSYSCFSCLLLVTQTDAMMIFRQPVSMDLTVNVDEETYEKLGPDTCQPVVIPISMDLTGDGDDENDDDDDSPSSTTAWELAAQTIPHR